MSRLEKEIRQELNVVENKTRLSKAKSVKFAPDIAYSADNKINNNKDDDSSASKVDRSDKEKLSLLKSKASTSKLDPDRHISNLRSSASTDPLKSQISSIDKLVSAERSKTYQNYNVQTVADDERSANSGLFTKFDLKLVLDTELVKKSLNEEIPNDLLLQGQGLAKIGDLREIKEIVENFRRLDISFNPFTHLGGLEQFSQLRHIYGYGCRLSNLTELQFVNKVETLMLQQNKIKKIDVEFLSFKKLKELRLDRNQLTSIDNLHCCTALRVLDLSWNRIESVEGLAGLQSLTELRLNNNCIESLVSFRSLPSVTELNVSYNKLKSLEGIQMLPTLMSVNASNNEITTVRIPQTYSHQHKVLDKASAAAGTTASSDKDGKTGVEKSGKKTKSGSLIRGAPVESLSVPSVSASNTLPPVAVLGMPCLCEVILRENKISDLSGIDTLGLSLETLDVSYNEISLKTDVVTPLKHLYASKGENALLNDLKLQGNPLLTKLTDSRLDRELELLAESLLEVCPKLELLNDCKIMVEFTTIHKGKSSPQKEKQEGKPDPNLQTMFTVKVLKPDSQEFVLSATQPNKVNELAQKKQQLVNLMSNVGSNSTIKQDYERLSYKIATMEEEKASLESELENIRKIGGVGTAAAMDRVRQRHLRIKDELNNMKEEKRSKETSFIQAQNDSRLTLELQKECQDLQKEIQNGGSSEKIKNDSDDDDNSVDKEGDEFDEETNRLNQRRKAPKLFLRDMSSFDTVASKENVFKTTMQLTRKTLNNIHDVPSDTDLDYKALSANYHAKLLEDAAEKMAKHAKKQDDDDNNQVAKIIAMMKYAKREKKPIVINKRASWEDGMKGPAAAVAAAGPVVHPGEPLFAPRKHDQAAMNLAQRQMRPMSGSGSRDANSFYLTGESPRLPDSSRVHSARSNLSDKSEPLTDVTVSDSRSLKKGLYVPEEFSRSFVSTTDSNKKHILDWTASGAKKAVDVTSQAHASLSSKADLHRESSKSINNNTTTSSAASNGLSRPRSAKEFSVGFDLRSIVANLDDEPNPAMLITKAHSARALDAVIESSNNNINSSGDKSKVASSITGNDGNKTPLTRSFSAPNVKNLLDAKARVVEEEGRTSKAGRDELNDSNFSSHADDNDNDDDDASGGDGAYATTATDYSYRGDATHSSGEENEIMFEDVHSLKSADLSPKQKLKPKLRPNNNDFLLDDFESIEKKLLGVGRF